MCSFGDRYDLTPKALRKQKIKVFYFAWVKKPKAIIGNDAKLKLRVPQLLSNYPWGKMSKIKIHFDGHYG